MANLRLLFLASTRKHGFFKREEENLKNERKRQKINQPTGNTGNWGSWQENVKEFLKSRIQKVIIALFVQMYMNSYTKIFIQVSKNCLYSKVNHQQEICNNSSDIREKVIDITLIKVQKLLLKTREQTKTVKIKLCRGFPWSCIDN